MSSIMDSLYTPQAVNPNPYTPSPGDTTLQMYQGTSANTLYDNNAASNSTFGKGGTMDQGLGMASKGMGAAASLGQIYVGLKSLDIAEEELGIKKDQWAMSKQELQHMQDTRKRLTSSYMGRSNQPQQTQPPKQSALAR